MSEPAAGTAAAPAWIADLPEDLRGNSTLAQFKGEQWKDVGPVLAKSYVEARSVMGKKAYDLPQPDWTPEKYTEWHKAIGVPDSPDKYPALDEKLAEKIGITKEVGAAALKKFHELGLTPRQTNGILNEWYLKEAANGATIRETTQKAAADKAVAELKAEFGDNFEAKSNLAASALNLVPGLKDEIIASGHGDNPKLFKMLVALGEKMMEDTTARGGKGTGLQDAKETAKSEIGQLILDKEFQGALMNGMHPGHSTALEKWTRLHRQATHG